MHVTSQVESSNILILANTNRKLASIGSYQISKKISSDFKHDFCFMFENVINKAFGHSLQMSEATVQHDIVVIFVVSLFKTSFDAYTTLPSSQDYHVFWNKEIDIVQANFVVDDVWNFERANPGLRRLKIDATDVPIPRPIRITQYHKVLSNTIVKAASSLRSRNVYSISTTLVRFSIPS